MFRSSTKSSFCLFLSCTAITAGRTNNFVKISLQNVNGCAHRLTVQLKCLTCHEKCLNDFSRGEEILNQMGTQQGAWVLHNIAAVSHSMNRLLEIGQNYWSKPNKSPKTPYLSSFKLDFRFCSKLPEFSKVTDATRWNNEPPMSFSYLKIWW